MTRHGKNCTAGAVYTYHERKRDTASSGYGTQAGRLGKDSIKDFDCCSITLQPCKHPVVTKDGYLFDKEAILEFILHQKNKYIKHLKEYERQKNSEKTELAELAEAERRSNNESFFKKEKSIISTPMSSFENGESSKQKEPLSNMVKGKDKQLPSFWVPQLTPQSKPTLVKKPEKAVLCPMSGKPIKMKDLMEVEFTLIKDPSDKKSLIAKRNRYMCAVTHDVLGNNIPCVILKTSGKVVTEECYEKLIKKDMIDPTNGKKLTDKDVIRMQRGGTGYSTANEKLRAKSLRPVLQC